MADGEGNLELPAMRDGRRYSVKLDHYVLLRRCLRNMHSVNIIFNRKCLLNILSAVTRNYKVKLQVTSNTQCDLVDCKYIIHCTFLCWNAT